MWCLILRSKVWHGVINVSKKVILYKNGCFYNAFGSDAILICKLMGYKYNEISNSVGFPIWALAKVRVRLEKIRRDYGIGE